MNETPRNDDKDLAAERAAKIENLAKPIIDAARKSELERHRHNENEMKKLARLSSGEPDVPLTDSEPPKEKP